ncbi:MAG: tyrosine-type recombinase/integrase [Bacteriovoracaceae bacterium]|nr:tyrosine-type recombinase/integrase [Bacteriovoracaceae bacterium]
MKIMGRSDYKKLKGVPGIYVNNKSGHYLAEKRIGGKLHSATFKSAYETKQWRKLFDGKSYKLATPDSQCSTLKEVWEVMQKVHFPTLATSTKDIWRRRYKLLETIEHLPMDQITPSKITDWVQYWVSIFSNDEYQSGRGKAGRCNLNNELNMFVSIFNWYKQSEQFEKEALPLTNPVKTKHKKLGFIKPLPDKRKQINVKDAFLFFDFLKPLYRDLAMMQFYCAGRVGEVAGMQWSNIDLKNRRLLIKQTCVWDAGSKMFLELKGFPKNREPRPVYITDEIMEVLNRRLAFRLPNNDYVFHVDGSPLNYGTIQVNYRAGQRKSGVPYTGTHILRHGMAKLARQVGGGLDAVLAMTGHKDLKLADHYSKSTEDDQKEFSQKIMEHIRKQKQNETLNQFDESQSESSFENVICLRKFKTGTNS